jgi:hypothetical protein
MTTHYGWSAIPCGLKFLEHLLGMVPTFTSVAYVVKRRFKELSAVLVDSHRGFLRFDERLAPERLRGCC